MGGDGGLFPQMPQIRVHKRSMKGGDLESALEQNPVFQSLQVQQNFDWKWKIKMYFPAEEHNRSVWEPLPCDEEHSAAMPRVDQQRWILGKNFFQSYSHVNFNWLQNEKDY